MISMRIKQAKAFLQDVVSKLEKHPTDAEACKLIGDLEVRGAMVNLGMSARTRRKFTSLDEIVG
eukprot:4144153-Pyramimonas_sp.AAC.1